MEDHNEDERRERGKRTQEWIARTLENVVDWRTAKTPAQVAAGEDWCADVFEMMDRNRLAKWRDGTATQTDFYEFDPVACAQSIAEREARRLSRGRPSTVACFLKDNPLLH